MCSALLVRHRGQRDVEGAIQVPSIDYPRRRVAIFKQSTRPARLPLRHIESAVGQEKPLFDMSDELRGFSGMPGLQKRSGGPPCDGS